MLGKYRHYLSWVRKPENQESFIPFPTAEGYVEVFKSCNTSPDNPHWAGGGRTWETWQALIDERVSYDPQGSSTLWDHIPSHKQPDLAAHTQKTLEGCMCVIGGKTATFLCCCKYEPVFLCITLFVWHLWQHWMLTLTSYPCREVFFSLTTPLQRVRAQG